MKYRYTEKDIELLGRIMRAEAIGEGREGMLKVGNVVTNRIIANCLTFRDVKTLSDVLYQPNQFASVNSPLYNSGRATAKEKELAKKALRGHKLFPATNALWFHSLDIGRDCRPTWFDQQLSGRHKNHCFYGPDPGVCDELS